MLAAAGAPDGVAWVDSEDVLIYTCARVRATHWSLDNPISFANRVTPQGFAGELVSVAVFTVGGMGRRLPSRPPPGRPMPEATPEIMSSFGKPLRLNGDERGVDEVRFHFEPEQHWLSCIEVIRGTPEGGAGGIAHTTFLR